LEELAVVPRRCRSHQESLLMLRCVRTTEC
jgi:hypothetical protein